MPIIIENHSPRDLPDDQPHRYRLRINGQHIAWFKHQRDQGLAVCLMEAAIAAAKEERKKEK